MSGPGPEVRLFSGRRFSQDPDKKQDPFFYFNARLEALLLDGWRVVPGTLHVEDDHDHATVMLQRERQTGTPFRG